MDQKGSFLISTDKVRLDLGAIHSFLTTSYWAKGISMEVVRRAIQNSLCFGMYEADTQIGFARVISDYATYAYLCDVYILEPYRRRGLAKWLMQCVLAHPDLQELRRFSLATKDAHGLYGKVGFAPLRNPASHMEILNQAVYQK